MVLLPLSMAHHHLSMVPHLPLMDHPHQSTPHHLHPHPENMVFQHQLNHPEKEEISLKITHPQLPKKLLLHPLPQ